MSGGLAQAYPSSHPAHELEVLREIGQIAWSAQNADIALNEIEAAVLRLGGVLRFEWKLNAMPGLMMEPVRANGVTWGGLRIHFDPALTALKISSGFTRFVAQQAALLLHRLSLLDEMQAHHRRLAVLRRRLETRKAVHRARGIVAKARGISESEALRVMKRQARVSRRSLLQLAQALIGGFETPDFERPALRRLHPEQVTNQPSRERRVAYA
jgi:hypothetical protein